MLIRVDLPAPFSPTSACTSPGRVSKLTPSNARTPGNRRLSCWTARTEGLSDIGGSGGKGNLPIVVVIRLQFLRWQPDQRIIQGLSVLRLARVQCNSSFAS